MKQTKMMSKEARLSKRVYEQVRVYGQAVAIFGFGLGLVASKFVDFALALGVGITCIIAGLYLLVWNKNRKVH